MTGRGGSASVRVKAGLDDMAVHVCGNLMNHNSMYLVDVWPGMDRGGDGGERPFSVHYQPGLEFKDTRRVFNLYFHLEIFCCYAG